MNGQHSIQPIFQWSTFNQCPHNDQQSIYIYIVHLYHFAKTHIHIQKKKEKENEEIVTNSIITD